MKTITIRALLLAVPALAILAGCSGEPQTDRSQEKPAADAQAAPAGAPQGEQTTFGLTEEGMNADKRVGSALEGK